MCSSAVHDSSPLNNHPRLLLLQLLDSRRSPISAGVCDESLCDVSSLPFTFVGVGKECDAAECTKEECCEPGKELFPEVRFHMAAWCSQRLYALSLTLKSHGAVVEGFRERRGWFVWANTISCDIRCFAWERANGGLVQTHFRPLSSCCIQGSWYTGRAKSRGSKCALVLSKETCSHRLGTHLVFERQPKGRPHHDARERALCLRAHTQGFVRETVEACEGCDLCT